MLNIVIDPSGRVLRAGFCDFSTDLQPGEQQISLQFDFIPDGITDMRWNGSVLEPAPPAPVTVQAPDPTAQFRTIWAALKRMGLHADPHATSGTPERMLADVEAAHGQQQQP